MIPTCLRAAATTLALVVAGVSFSACQSPQDKAYLEAINKHTALTDKINKVQSSCKDQPGPACTSAARDAKAEADSFSKDLKGLSVSSCEADADAKLKTALAAFTTSLQTLADASAASDIPKGNGAIDQLNSGIDSYNAAVDSSRKANC